MVFCFCCVRLRQVELFRRFQRKEAGGLRTVKPRLPPQFKWINPKRFRRLCRVPVVDRERRGCMCLATFSRDKRLADKDAARAGGSATIWGRRRRAYPARKENFPRTSEHVDSQMLDLRGWLCLQTHMQHNKLSSVSAGNTTEPDYATVRIVSSPAVVFIFSYTLVFFVLTCSIGFPVYSRFRVLPFVI